MNINTYDILTDIDYQNKIQKVHDVGKTFYTQSFVFVCFRFVSTRLIIYVSCPSLTSCTYISHQKTQVIIFYNKNVKSLQTSPYINSAETFSAAKEILF